MVSAQAHERIGAQGSRSEELLACLGMAQTELRVDPVTAWGFANNLTSTACHFFCCMCAHKQVNISLLLLICWSASSPHLGFLFHPTSHFRIACFLQRDTKKLPFKTMAHLPPPFREAFRNKVSMEEAQPSPGLEVLGLDFRVP